ncbi:MAG: 16S rRNA (adenine(1518)-N(6)/adenine(1519)-N(6))-dimethyltransferase RsmA [Rugosibacter sp.]|nr:16S rRNA (adenine(1518)-N(6)/adenine(1519)-N(6))-dimethyltransferase RsmA [Rugosibacter sp.]
MKANAHQGHVARKRFGQNFLVDDKIIRAIVDAIGPKNGDTVVEIGPGLGALTAPLLDRLPHLDVVEIDRDLIARLRQRWPAERLTVHAGDALEFDFGTLKQSGPLKIVGNLPYNISGPLLFHLADFADAVHDMHFMLQKEVVDRMVAEPGTPDRGRLSVMLQYRFHIERLFAVPPESFNPAPKVDSAIVRLIPKRLQKIGADETTGKTTAQQEGAGQNPARFAVDALQGSQARNAFLVVADGTAAKDEALLARVVSTAFSQRRKMLRNTLRSLADVAMLDAVSIVPTARAEELGVEDFVRLADALAERAHS